MLSAFDSLFVMDANRDALPGLERSCRDGPGTDSGDWVRVAPAQADGTLTERIEARFGGAAYAPHRHDTYALGLTLDGVQSFNYRGELRNSLPGHAIVLHPDELHDGHAGVEGGFRYRMIYIDPEEIGTARRETARALPFVAGGVRDDPRLAAALLPALADLDRAMEPLEWAAAVAEIADALARIDPSAPAGRKTPPDTEAVRRAKSLMLENLEDNVGLDALEHATGQSRFALARHFRRVCGVSPHRWLVLRRLDRVRTAICAGDSLADAAANAGFADQAHMTRHFKSAYGMTPRRWLAHIRHRAT